MVNINGIGSICGNVATSTALTERVDSSQFLPMLAEGIGLEVTTTVSKVCKKLLECLDYSSCPYKDDPMIHQQLKLLSVSDKNIKPGRHNLCSPVIGSRANELQAIQEMIKNEPVLEKLEEVIHKNENIFLIPIEKKDEADQIAREIFRNYVSKWSTAQYTEHNIVDWTPERGRDRYEGVFHVYDLENEWNTWCGHAVVAASGSALEKGPHYLPPGVIAYRELMHVEETPLCVEEKKYSKLPGVQLLPTLKTIMLVDYIYKKTHALEESCEVDYGRLIGRTSLSSFANFYRQQEAIHGTLSAALISPESIAFLKTCNLDDALSRLRPQQVLSQTLKAEFQPAQEADCLFAV